jgi:hypothetical protein
MIELNIPLLIFFIIDAAFILYYFWKTVRGYFFLKELITWESAKGKLIFLEKKKQLNKLYCYPVVEFKTNNFKTISFRSERIEAKGFSGDEPLEILYDPYAPNKAVIKGYEKVKFKEGISGTVIFTIFNVTLAVLFLLVKFSV